MKFGIRGLILGFVFFWRGTVYGITFDRGYEIFSKGEIPGKIPMAFLKNHGAVRLKEMDPAFGELLVRLQAPEVNIVEKGEPTPRDRTKKFVLPPLFKKLTWNEVDVFGPNDRAEAKRMFFEESSWAFVPTDKSILITYDKRGREVWNYPEGFFVLHEIRFKNQFRTLFELRVVARGQESWNYGVYEPADWEGKSELEFGSKLATGENSNSSKSFLLERGFQSESRIENRAFFNFHSTHKKKYEQKYLGELSVLSSSLGKPAFQSCKACHFSSSPAAYQYSSAEAAGPCGFVPPNPYLKTQWHKKYKEKYPHAVGPFRSL